MHRLFSRPTRSPRIDIALGLLFAGIMFSSTPSRAQLEGPVATVWPTTHVRLPLRPTLVVSDPERRLAVLDDGGRAELVAKGHRVRLRPVALDAAAGSNHTVLEATANLRTSTRYALRVYARGQTRNRLRTPRFAWTTAATDAAPAPLDLDGPPAVLQRRHAGGCVEFWEVEMAIPARSGTALGAWVTFSEVNSPEPPRARFVPMRGGTLWIGHASPSGVPPADDDLIGVDRRWQAVLTLVDAAGRTLEVPEALVFAGIPRQGPSVRGAM